MRHMIGLATASLTLTAILAAQGPAPWARPTGAPVPAEPVRATALAPADAGSVRPVRVIPIDGRYGASRPASRP